MKLAATLMAALAMGALPLLTSSNYILGMGLRPLIFTVPAAALNLIYGYTGLLPLAQLGFWGIGGYVSALTVVTFGGTFWTGVLWAAFVNAVVALVVGYPTLRTNRHAFVIVTLTFALLVTLIARDWVELTRGPMGIPNLPAPSAFGHRFASTHDFYWIAWAFSVAMLALLYALCGSRIGRTLTAIKQNEPLVRAQGISPMPYKLTSFAISAAITGAAGGVFVFHLGIVDPLILDFYYMQTFLIIVIIGGGGSFLGGGRPGIPPSAPPRGRRLSPRLRLVHYRALPVGSRFSVSPPV